MRLATADITARNQPDGSEPKISVGAVYAKVGFQLGFCCCMRHILGTSKAVGSLLMAM
jgi:hypothetical protein